MAYPTDKGRRASWEVRVGGIGIGGGNPIRIQSMTTTPTMDTLGSVAQAKRIIDAGGELVRLTCQGVREAENLANIKGMLVREGYEDPIVADVHFNPNVADVAALYADKVRINPGNYVDPARRFRYLEYSDEEYEGELRRLEDRLVPFLEICKKHGRAIRIGVNHGSLSDRIMSRFGDTPEGIAESCMEFLRICRKHDFGDVVVSVKASNTGVMVRSVRLLVAMMEKEGMYYPLHLGVTEAGEGEDGRIRSCVGIGALLHDGIGDTIRVSLSEEPEAEIPVARHLVEYITGRRGKLNPETPTYEGFDYINPERRNGIKPVVVADEMPRNMSDGDLKPDYIGKEAEEAGYYVVSAKGNDIREIRSEIHKRIREGKRNPIVVRLDYSHRKEEKELFQIEASADMGPIMFDGLADGIWLRNKGDIDQRDIIETSFSILQAGRLRFTKTEYVSCPGCGRTLYDLRQTIASIKEATKGMTGLKIAIMGCIVNGPGEMADADYGYVGSGRGRISLYRRKECVEKNIPEEEAVERLLSLINKDKEEGI